MARKKPYYLKPDYNPATQCERCGGKLTVVMIGKLGPLEVSLVRCPNGHEYNRYRLSDVGS